MDDTGSENIIKIDQQQNPPTRVQTLVLSSISYCKGGLSMKEIQSANDLLDLMWQDYCDFNPAARRIFDLLTAQGEQVLNDHIALRTFQHPRLGISSMAHIFEKFGYKNKGEYFFKEKKLYANHWEHSDLSLPKIFISELELSKMSPFVQKTLEALIEQIPQIVIDSPTMTIAGRPWKIDHATYQKLADESEYAGWVAAYGFRPNHFTVNVNALKKWKELSDLNNFIKANGYKLNASGGEIKGTPDQLLEQSSTMAEKATVQFTDGSFQIPACYYEFAKRYAMKDGKLYQGFIAASADKIFESTNRH